VYDLRSILNVRQANLVHKELFMGDGRDGVVWPLAKTDGCNGLFLPSDPPTMFVFNSVYDEMVDIGPADPEPVEARP
jgi:hypothetical protein